MDKGKRKNWVNFSLTTMNLPADVALALNYAVPGMEPLMRFDRTLAATVSGARDPSLAQLRLAWWRTQLDAPVAGSEGYDAVRRFGPALLAVIDGWEQLLAPMPLGEGALSAYGKGRGTIFTLLGGDAVSGAGWALADFARNCSDAPTRGLARMMADRALRCPPRQPKPLRVLTSLARTGQIKRWTLLRAALS